MSPLPPDLPLLRVQNLSKFYGRTIGCNNISFELAQGEVIGIVGESGSGNPPCSMHCRN